MNMPLLKRLRRSLVLVPMVASLAACAIGPRLVHTQVTSFNEWSSLPVDKTYSFARTLEYQKSLEMQSYEDIVRDELALQGFKLASDASRASLVVTLRPSIATTSVLVPDPWSDPFLWGPYGFYGRGFYGRGFYGPGFGFYGPFVGYDNFDGRPIDVFHKSLELDIDSQATTGKRFYEGKVETTSRNGSLPQAMPVLIRALFTDFPGNNGQTRRVDVPIEPAR